MPDSLPVNAHYLDRVIAVAETSGVEATEDILAGNGMKLVAKGARIDANSKERLLMHKLRKPLESLLRVIDGVGARDLDKVAQQLLDKHALLARVCGNATAKTIAVALRDLRLSTPLESLLSIYAAQAPNKLEHAVGVGLLGACMFRDLPEGGAKGVQTMLVAGLMHDVGELYIDPAFLETGKRLTPDQWKHIAAHPVVSAHLLTDMPGAGPQVAKAVLFHHERLDGFGYPHGARGSTLPLSGQVLALSETLMGLLESGASPAERASVAVKLIPGEFHRLLLDRVTSAAKKTVTDKASGAAAQEYVPPTQDMEKLVLKVSALSANFHQLRKMEDDIVAQINTASPALKELMAHVIERCLRIRLAFSSTGLDTHSPEELRERLEAMDPGVHHEVAIVLREIDWRLREVKREVRRRAEKLPAAEASLVQQFINMAKQRAVSATQTTTDDSSALA